MDMKEKIKEIVEQIAKDPELRDQFEKEPVKALEKVLNVDLPDELIEAIIDGVKANLTAENLSDVASTLKKLF